MKVTTPDYMNIFPEDIKMCPEDLKPVLEMASNLSDYKSHLAGNAFPLYQHVIYVTVLGNRLPGYVEHWKHEILNFTRPVIMTVLKKSSKNADRAELIKKYMMQPQMGAEFEDYDVEQFETALKIEIKKGENMLRDSAYRVNWPSIRNALKILNDTLNNINGVPEICKEEIQNFYDKLCAAATAVTKDGMDAGYELLDNAVNSLNPVIK